MTMEAQLTSLHKKHQAIEEKLRSESLRPRPDDATIQILKKNKLLIKEQIAEIDKHLAATNRLS